MLKIRFALIAASLGFLLPSALVSLPQSAPAIVGYVFAHNAPLPPGQIDAHNLTRINYAFANISDGRMVVGSPADAGNFAILTALRQQNPSLTVVVSVGGWLWSTDFSDVALTSESRALFTQSAIDFLSSYRLDGLDVDWEYPGMSGQGHKFRPEDKRNFTLLLTELRRSFTQESKKTGKKIYLTIAAGASDEFLAHTEMTKVSQVVDTVNLMSYDYYEPGSGPVTGHHAPLFTNPRDPARVSADASVRAFERAGVPPAKMLLGVPFYGHIWGQVSDTNHGLFEPGKPMANGYAPYSLIESSMLDRGFTRYWDPVSSVPYLYSAEKRIFVSYEDAQSLAAKCDYMLSRKLGGIMFWEYSGDPAGKLLETIHSSLHRSGKSAATQMR